MHLVDINQPVYVHAWDTISYLSATAKEQIKSLRAFLGDAASEMMLTYNLKDGVLVIQNLEVFIGAERKGGYEKLCKLLDPTPYPKLDANPVFSAEQTAEVFKNLPKVAREVAV